MMTLHSAKGLEFRTVFIAGAEENIFPSSRSMQDESRLEEERRLMYVGITRARFRLFISRARERSIYNQVSYNPPSRFLSEIPARLLDGNGPNRRDEAFGRNRTTASRAAYGGRSLGEPRKNLPVTQIGKPRLTFQGKSLDEIPGVTRGINLSKAREESKSAINRLFQPGERVLHRKFGAGVVKEIVGSGADARIMIEFTAYGKKEFSLSIAPIVKLED